MTDIRLWHPSVEGEPKTWELDAPIFMGLEVFAEQNTDKHPVGDLGHQQAKYAWVDEEDLPDFDNVLSDSWPQFEELADKTYIAEEHVWWKADSEEVLHKPITAWRIRDNIRIANERNVRLHKEMLSKHYEHAKLCLQASETIRAAKRACFDFIATVNKYPCRNMLDADFCALRIIFEAKVAHIKARDAENKRLRDIYNARMEAQAEKALILDACKLMGITAGPVVQEMPKKIKLNKYERMMARRS